ncbi:hypothetical protein BTR25_14065 [Bacillus sp. MRMR6]|nr:hypothetical protein BTR25_14065 [Bacillus sp. MRMR6]
MRDVLHDAFLPLFEKERELNEVIAQMAVASPEELEVLLEKMGEIQDALDAVDEPTNHLGVTAKEELKRALREYKGTVVLVCHEPDFYEDWVTKVWNVEEWSQNANS